MLRKVRQTENIFLYFISSTLPLVFIYIDLLLEISAIMGTDTTPNGIIFQFTDRFKSLAKRQLAMRDACLDPKDVVVDGKGG